jgi:hypothetical protein
MTYILDTNILLYTLRKPNFYSALDRSYDFANPANETQISEIDI